MSIINKCTVVINSLKYEFCTPMSVYGLLNYLGFNTEIILIDYNGIILAKKGWEKTLLKNNDMLEIITIAGGG